MIQGTSSNVGKSLLVAALCRIFARKGLRVFPFKSQNMALNSFVTSEGLEIGRAQALQATAAKRNAEVAMNPVLLKPEGNSSSQVVLMGKPWRRLSGGEYYKAKPALWGTITEVLDTIRKKNDLLIVEGAGSPAEINLKEHEIVNMRVASYLQAPVLLAADIDRGGVFAFLYGTLALLEPEERELVKGFIINKFRGDVELLKPGLDMLRDLTGGVPTLGVVPYLKEISLAQEDSVFLEEHRFFGSGSTGIAVILLPHISNYDDFDALTMEPGLQLRFVEHPRELGNPAAIILPGTKTTMADLLWLRQSGLAEAICRKAEEGTSIIGMCGGFQMLGKRIIDKEGVEGSAGSLRGLGLLDVTTYFSREKKTIQETGVLCSNQGTLAPLKGCKVDGYEIHMGHSALGESAGPFLATGSGGHDGAVSPDGRIIGTYFHGLFDEAAFRRGWLASLGWEPEGKPVSLVQKREEELVALADEVEAAIDMKQLEAIIGL